MENLDPRGTAGKVTTCLMIIAVLIDIVLKLNWIFFWYSIGIIMILGGFICTIVDDYNNKKNKLKNRIIIVVCLIIAEIFFIFVSIKYNSPIYVYSFLIILLLEIFLYTFS